MQYNTTKIQYNTTKFVVLNGNVKIFGESFVSEIHAKSMGTFVAEDKVIEFVNRTSLIFPVDFPLAEHAERCNENADLVLLPPRGPLRGLL